MSRNVYHLPDQARALGRILHVLDLIKQPVKFRVTVVGRIFAVQTDLAVRAVQQEKEILGIRIIRIPAPLEDLCRALEHLVLETVVVSTAYHQLQVDLAELLGQPVQSRLRIRPRGCSIEVQHQRFSCLDITSIRITRLCQ